MDGFVVVWEVFYVLATGAGVIMCVLLVLAGVGATGEAIRNSINRSRLRSLLGREPTELEVWKSYGLVNRAYKYLRVGLGKEPTVEELAEECKAWSSAQNRVQRNREGRRRAHVRDDLRKQMGRDPSQAELEESMAGKTVHGYDVRVPADLRDPIWQEYVTPEAQDRG